MSLYTTFAAATDHLVGRLLRRAMLALIMVIGTLIAVYHATVAGTVSLEVLYGTVHAHLIIAGIYAVVVLIALSFWFVMNRRKPAPVESAIENAPIEAKMAMLVEAVMLGYSMAKKGEKAS